MSDRKKIRIDKKKEMRTKEISKMIDEGGLGADNYYKIVKDSTSNQTKNLDETAKEENSEWNIWKNVDLI